jgi:2-oxoisovalerate dehydrogenase E1 component subunit alpha
MSITVETRDLDRGGDHGRDQGGLVQVLRPDGSVDPSSPRPALPEGRELEMFEAMCVTRALDQQFVNLQRQGELALYAPCRGQEAAQVGAAFALSDADWIFPQYRELGFWVVGGIDPIGVGSLWRGVWHGGAGLLEGRSATMSVPIGTHALHAVGYAMGASLDREPAVAVACIGDGATSEGDVHEALNFAAVYDAPCVFYVQNNQWAISTPVHEQTRSHTLAEKAAAYGMPGVRCDGNDALACYGVMHDAIERARRGGGPTLVEAVTYRLEAHTTADDATRYRSAEELAFWENLDPIPRFRRYLEGTGRLDDETSAAIDRRAADAAQRLREGVLALPDADPLEVFEHVFVERTPALAEQADELRRELRG